MAARRHPREWGVSFSSRHVADTATQHEKKGTGRLQRGLDDWAQSRIKPQQTCRWKEQAPERSTALGQVELVALFPHRFLTSKELWLDTLRHASKHLDVLTYAAFWLGEEPAFHRLLADKARAGVSIRILLGDPASAQVAQRGIDEGIGDAIASKIRNTIINFGPLISMPGIEFRLHGTVLQYVSLQYVRLKGPLKKLPLPRVLVS